LFDHVTIRVADPAGSKRFYETVLAPLGIELDNDEGWLVEWDDFSFSPADDEHPPTRGLHVGFAAPSREHVDASWRAGTEAGFRDAGEPGPRPQYRDDYYGGFLLDPDGNSAEAVHHGDMREPGHIDHLWIRVADVPAAGEFYRAIAPYSGFELDHSRDGFAHFLGAGGSFSLVGDGGPPTEHLHIAFPATDNGTVDAFHEAAVGAGYRDNGGPGERPAYHEGYYGAFVLDPDGNNVEVVCHNRRSH
jgi:catechol 2,3-dioxygenase-like lactoylglutathione lyase family enzyme